MSEPTFDLDQVRVASPCEEPWDAMTGDDRSRHCARCQLNVYDISEMTRDEAQQFLSGSIGRACVRLHRRADGRLITRDCPVGRGLVRRARSRVMAAVAGVFTLLLAAALFGRNREPTLYGLSRVDRSIDFVAHKLRVTSLCRCVSITMGMAPRPSFTPGAQPSPTPDEEIVIPR